MAKIQCKMCGGTIELPEGMYSGECPYCGTLTTFPKVSSEELENLYNRAEHFRRINEYDKAVSAYEKIVEVNPDDAEAYWGLVISKFGIEYVEDPVSHERIPTCHRVHYESILADADYLNALEKAGSYEKGIYEAEAKRIAEIQRDILSISNNEQPFDIFICYKESDNFGKRTKDSVTAQEIYYQLTNAGYKVFFSRITLESKLGQQYEPYIFAALNSAKVMLVIGSQKEYFDAVWVRNEWSRFLALMKKDRSKLLIPCYKDMDAYDIPEALSMFQAQDMGKIGFIQDLLHGIKKVMDKTAPASAGGGDVKSKDHPFLQKAKLFLETADFDSAKEYCEKLLDINPENGWAYFYRLMAENQVNDEKLLVDIAGIDQQKTFQLAQRFADNALTATLTLTGITDKIHRRAEEEQRRLEEEARRKAEDLRLRNETTQRWELLNRYINAYKSLNNKNGIIHKLTDCKKSETRLLESDNWLNKNTVSPVQTVSEALINSLPDIVTLEGMVKKKIKKRKFIRSLVIIILLVAFGVAICYEVKKRQEAKAVEQVRIEAEARQKIQQEAERQRLEAEAERQRLEAEAERQRQQEAERQRQQQEVARNLQTTSTFTARLPGNVTLELVRIPKGEFMMGSPATEDGRDNDEVQHRPRRRRRSDGAEAGRFYGEIQHRVTLTKDFFLGKYEVTQAQWQAVMGNDPSYFKGPHLPVEQVSWDDAMQFCETLTATGHREGWLPENWKFTLPTEAQWEYACRAGTDTPFSYGNQSDVSKMNFDGNWPYGGANKGVYRRSTVEVGSLGYRNNFGLYDMHGNVGEWCLDYYDSYSSRVLRGGSWYCAARDCRSADRGSYDPANGASYVGFRLALVEVQ